MSPRWLVLLLVLQPLAAESSALHIKRCDSRLGLVLESQELGRYEGSLCVGGGRPGYVLADDETPDVPSMLVLTIGAEGNKEALVVTDQAQADQVYWRSEKFDPKASFTELTPVRAGLSATRLQSTPATEKEPVWVEIEAEAIAGDQMLDAIVAETGIRVGGARPGKQRVTFKFGVIDARTLIALIADDQSLAQTHAADGTINLKPYKNKQAFDDAMTALETAMDSEDRSVEDSAIAAIRELATPAPGLLLPGNVEMYLGSIALKLELADDFSGLVALNRDRLTFKLEEDARPDSLGVAIYRAELAHALQLFDPKSTEPTQLLRTAEPVLLGKIAEQTSSDFLIHQGIAFRRLGKIETATRLFEHALDQYHPVYTYGWEYTGDRIVFELLQMHQKAGRRDAYTRALRAWRERTKDTTWRYPWNLERDVTALAEAGKFADAANAMEAINAMMPPMADVPDDELAHALKTTFRHTLASGDVRRAAALHQLMLKVAAARLPAPDELSERIRKYQAFLDQLAAPHTKTLNPLHDRFSATESPGPGQRQMSPYTTELFVETKVVLPELISRRLPNDTGAGWITAIEIAALLALHDEVGQPDLATASQHFELAQAIRKLAGQSDAEQATRQQWFDGEVTRLVKSRTEPKH